jgi:hypothetical protein
VSATVRASSSKRATRFQVAAQSGAVEPLIHLRDLAAQVR